MTNVIKRYRDTIDSLYCRPIIKRFTDWLNYFVYMVYDSNCTHINFTQSVNIVRRYDFEHIDAVWNKLKRASPWSFAMLLVSSTLSCSLCFLSLSIFTFLSSPLSSPPSFSHFSLYFSPCPLPFSSLMHQACTKPIENYYYRCNMKYKLCWPSFLC